MTKIYKAKVGKTFWISASIVLVAVLAALWFSIKSSFLIPWGMLAFIAPVSMLVWIYFDTWYKIENDTLLYKSGFLKGKIPVKSIVKIKTNTTRWTGTKPALAANGLVVKYERFKEVYIAPQEELSFLEDLKFLNNEIEIE